MDALDALHGRGRNPFLLGLDRVGGVISSLRDDNAIRRGVKAADDWSNEQLRYILGPQGHEAASGASRLAREMTPAADFRDYVDYGGRAVQAARKGDPMGLLGNAGWAGLAMLGVALPGSVGMVDEAAQGAKNGIRAYHGSPHDFDKFSMDKIGTGEGAQAYGHGLYFAEAEEVGKQYRDRLARPYYMASDGRDIAEKYGEDILDIFERSGGDPQELRDIVQRKRTMVSRSLADHGVSDISELKPAFEGDLASTTIKWNDDANKLEDLLNSGDIEQAGLGHMYEVNINADPEDFLDWDKPLSEQPQKVREALGGIYPSGLKGGEAYQMMMHDSRNTAIARGDNAATTLGASQAKASEDLKSLGIPGLKYLDGMSRSAGKGSSNYVVFDDNLIEILRKYGLAGLIGGGGLATLGVPQAEAQDANR